jgi:hypothetical protein
MISKFTVGDIVSHDFSHILGTVTEVRDETFNTYVLWDNRPEFNDWYRDDALVVVRGTVPSGEKAVLTMDQIRNEDAAERTYEGVDILNKGKLGSEG